VQPFPLPQFNQAVLFLRPLLSLLQVPHKFQPSKLKTFVF
jgi:hypothetical protein